MFSQADAIFPDSFWRIVEGTNKFAFKFGDQTTANVKVHFMNDGSVGVGAAPSGTSVLLELSSVNQGFVIPRVSSIGSVNGRRGMMVYDAPASCFKFFQAGNLGATTGWSPCLGVVDGVRVEDAEPIGVFPGQLYYNSQTKTLYVFDTTGQWVTVSADKLTIDNQPPQIEISRPGDLYFNSDTNQLQIFDGVNWESISIDFDAVVSVQANCVDRVLQNGSKTFACGGTKFLGSLKLEADAWTNQSDNHTPPEINGFECCDITFIDQGTRTFDCDNLIINGDFEAGDTGFTSGYTLFAP